MSDQKHQASFEFEPAYEEYAGVKHEFTGTLFVPTAEECERIEREAAARAKPLVGIGEPSLFVPPSCIPGKPRGSVKMKMRDALALRTKH